MTEIESLQSEVRWVRSHMADMVEDLFAILWYIDTSEVPGLAKQIDDFRSNYGPDSYEYYNEVNGL